MASPQREYAVIAILLCIFGALTAQAVISGRAYVRDDLRQQDITHLKQALEKYFNAHEFYVTPPAGQSSCTSSSAESWFFSDASPLLAEQHTDAIPHDVRERSGFKYTYCATHQYQGNTTGYYLEAEMETNKQPGRFFDEDEKRKFGYRIMKDGNRTLYRVCGGSETQCDPKD